MCRGNGRCGTSRKLDNCGTFDIYVRDFGDEEEEWYEDDEQEENEEDETETTDEDEEEDDEDEEKEEEDDDDDEDEDEEEDFDPPVVPSQKPTRQPSRRSTLPPSRSRGPFKWPLYSQQCFDDAGPPFLDDAETFGPGGSYHDKGKAEAVLTPSNQCALPVRAACEARAEAEGGKVTPSIARASYLEGPLQCGGRGWFCRILPDPAHDLGIERDWNFNHCNATRYGDSAGHCHGSDSQDTYYWWVRDHWHRNYAGRLHCCCGWGAESSMVGVVSRCDYRALLQPGENEKCRDANEDHQGPGSGFSKGFELGCPNLGQKSPLPEPDQAQCWDVLRFAPGGRDD